MPKLGRHFCSHKGTARTEGRHGEERTSPAHHVLRGHWEAASDTPGIVRLFSAHDKNLYRSFPGREKE